MERIHDGVGGIAQQIAAPQGEIGISAFPREISLERDDSPRDEDCVGGQRFQVNRVRNFCRWSFSLQLWFSGMNPSVGTWLQRLRSTLGGTPARAVKGRQRDSPPAQPVVANGLSGLHAHDDG